MYRWFNDQSIKFKLIFTVLVITLIPVLTVGFLSYQTAYQAVYSLTSHDLRYMTHTKAQELNAVITQEKENHAKVEQIIHEVKEKYFQPQGMQGYAYLLDSKGKVLVHPDPNTQGKDLSGEKFVETIITEGTGYIEYDWNGEKKVVAFESLSNGNIIAIGSYLDDLLMPIIKIKLNMQIISVMASLLSILVGYAVVRKITGPIRDLVRAMREAEQGDLTVHVLVKAKDEIGSLSAMFNQMMDQLRNMLSQVHEVSEQVAASSQELTASANECTKATEHIAIASEEIADGSQNQMNSVLSTIGKIQDMNHRVKQITENVNKVNRDSESATQFAHNGEKNLNEVVEQMSSISDKVKRTEHVIRELGNQSTTISGIIQTIHDISQQTNLLSLNAAIEAARAGEHGRGFAVVANEVRKLAEQSSVSAEEISKLIIHINQEISHAVNSMEESTEAVGTGRKVVEETSGAFAQIIGAIDDVKDQIGEITMYAKEISIGSEHIVIAAEEVSRLAEVASADTQEVAMASVEQSTTMEEINSASEVLAQMAEQLQEQVNRFKI